MTEASNTELLPQLIARWQEVAPDAVGIPVSLASVAVVLRAVGLSHQAAHWQTKGTTFYSDHLLFKRIYKAIPKELDSISEKIVALGDPILVCPIRSSQLALELLGVFGRVCVVPDSEKLVALSLAAELGFLRVLETATQAATTDGVENLLQSIADKHESHVYLLQQRAKS